MYKIIVRHKKGVSAVYHNLGKGTAVEMSGAIRAGTNGVNAFWSKQDKEHPGSVTDCPECVMEIQNMEKRNE